MLRFSFQPDAEFFQLWASLLAQLKQKKFNIFRLNSKFARVVEHRASAAWSYLNSDEVELSKLKLDSFATEIVLI